MLSYFMEKHVHWSPRRKWKGLRDYMEEKEVLIP
jgi:hypothetical protein